MQDDREALIARIVEGQHRFNHRCLELGADREWAEVDLTMPQLKVLFAVSASGGLSMTQLGRSVGMTLSTATGVVDRLIAQELVRRESDPGDRRLVLLHTTDNGAALVDRLIQVGQEYLRLFVRRLSVEELALVAKAQEIVWRAMLEISAEKKRCQE